MNKQYQNNRTRNYLNNRSNYKNYHNRSRDSSQSRNSNHQNRQRNFSQSPHINITQYQNSQQNYRSSTHIHQRQINQVQSNEETQSDPHGFDNPENTELQLNHINCESTDDESETENTFPINMLQIESEHETPIESNFYQNNEHNSQNPDNTQKVTVYTEQELKGSSSTNNKNQKKKQIKHNYTKKLDNPLSLRKSKVQRFSITRPRNCFFLVDTGA